MFNFYTITVETHHSQQQLKTRIILIRGQISTILSLFHFIIQINLQEMSVQHNINDPIFINKALKMGYTRQDLAPLTIEKVFRDSVNVVKDMSDMERQYYVEKKLKALQERQNKIISDVSQQSRIDGSRPTKKGFNPVIKKLLQDHEARLQKRARYEQRARVSKTRDVQHRKISNTIDFGRTSPNFSNSAKGSRISKQSMRSQDSRQSSRSNSSHKDRLMLVRMKEKQAEKYKKNIFRYNQNESKKKLQRVHNNRLSQSRRIKTKSQISQQAVQQRKQQLQSLRHDQMRDHLQKLKYKMLKNEYIKQRQQEKRINKSIPHDSLYKKQLKNMFENNEKEQNRLRYEEKLRSVQRKKREIEQMRRMQMEKKLREQKLKQQHVMKFRQHMVMEGEHRKQQTLYYENQNLERAKNQKLEIQSEKKMKLLQSRVKQEIVKSNFESMENRRKIQSQAKARQIHEKLQEIKDIEKIKKKLTRQRHRNSFNRNSGQDHKFSFY